MCGPFVLGWRGSKSVKIRICGMEGEEREEGEGSKNQGAKNHKRSCGKKSGNLTFLWCACVVVVGAGRYFGVNVWGWCRGGRSGKKLAREPYALNDLVNIRGVLARACGQASLPGFLRELVCLAGPLDRRQPLTRVRCVTLPGELSQEHSGRSAISRRKQGCFRSAGSASWRGLARTMRVENTGHP